jgi:hypothetical protein
MAESPTITFSLTSNDAGTAAHLYSPHREHDTDGTDCWCHPTFYRICDDCEEGCWKCDNGKNEISAEEAASADEPLLIVHRYP